MSTKEFISENGSSSSANELPAASAPADGAIAAAARRMGKREGAEHYDAILWRLFARRDEDDGAGYLLGVSSSAPRSGVTTLTTNLAVRAADQGMGPVLLADGNVRHPQLHRLLGADRATGLADVLSGEATLALSAQATSVPGLDFLRLGTRDLLNYAQLNRRQFRDVANELRESYALTFVDLPEADALGHMMPFARELDATLLVFRSGHVKKAEARRAAAILTADGVPLAGAVVTASS
jgi:tyrosine-protein kinase Etk/Wzc